MPGGGTSSKGNQLKFKERRVFLFEQIILLSEMTEKKRGSIVSTYYLFKNSLKVIAGDVKIFEIRKLHPVINIYSF